MTPRNRSLFLDVGHAYVYLCYGTSYMLNVSSEAAGTGAGVLLRALEPLSRDRVHAPRDAARARATCCADPVGWPPRCGSISSMTASICSAAAACGSAATAPKSAAIGESVRIGLTKGAEARLRYFVPAAGT